MMAIGGLGPRRDVGFPPLGCSVAASQPARSTVRMAARAADGRKACRREAPQFWSAGTVWPGRTQSCPLHSTTASSYAVSQSSPMHSDWPCAIPAGPPRAKTISTENPRIRSRISRLRMFRPWAVRRVASDSAAKALRHPFGAGNCGFPLPGAFCSNELRPGFPGVPSPGRKLPHSCPVPNIVG